MYKKRRKWICCVKFYESLYETGCICMFIVMKTIILRLCLWILSTSKYSVYIFRKWLLLNFIVLSTRAKLFIALSLVYFVNDSNEWKWDTHMFCLIRFHLHMKLWKTPIWEFLVCFGPSRLSVWMQSCNILFAALNTLNDIIRLIIFI